MNISVEGITKSFEGRAVVAGLSFKLKPGRVMGILGPAEAGKSIVLQILLNMIPNDTGSVTFDEQPISGRIRNVIGYLPQHRGLYNRYSTVQLLVYFARLKGMQRKKAQVEAVRLLDRFGMIEDMELPLEALNEEERQKVYMMTAIIHNPQVVFLDEPFENMTTDNQVLIGKMVQRFREDGKTIVIASRELNKAEELCDEVILMDAGEVVLQGNVADIQERFRENVMVIEASDNLKRLNALQGVKRMIHDGREARLYVDRQIPPHKMLDTVVKTVNIRRIEINRCRLADVFQDMTHEKEGSDQ